MKAVIQGNVQTQNGALKVDPDAVVSIFHAGTEDLAPLWTNRDGSSPKGNPFQVDANGDFRVYVNPGRYDVKAEGDAGTSEWLDLPAWEDALSINELANSIAQNIYTSIPQALSETSDGDLFWHVDSARFTLYENDDGSAIEIARAPNLADLELAELVIGTPDGGGQGAGTINSTLYDNGRRVANLESSDFDEVLDNGQRLGQIRARVTVDGTTPIVSHVRNPLSGTFSVSRPVIGAYIVTHDLGTSDYVVHVTGIATHKSFAVASIGSSSFAISVEDFDGTTQDPDGFFVTVSRTD